MVVFGICQSLGRYFGDLNKNGRYSVFKSPNDDGNIQFLIENTTVTVIIQKFAYGVTVIFEKINGKGPSKNYVTARGGRGSTILLHIVTYILGGGGYFMK